MTPVADAVGVVGAGPSGLMAAETIARTGRRAIVFDQMPSPARKFLMAGRGGLNLTHSDPLEHFLEAYRDGGEALHPAVRDWTPDDLIAWAHGLGIKTFVGSSGRVFPTAMKASPLLRAWLARLSDLGVEIRTRHRLVAISKSRTLRLETPDGLKTVTPRAIILAVGGASWPRLGSDGQWRDVLQKHDIETRAFAPSNCGVFVEWSPLVRERFSGIPLKRIALTCGERTARGELVVTASGLEGGAVYALSPEIRRALSANPTATLTIDLRPDLSHEALADRLSRLRGRQSLSNYLRKSAGLDRLQTALLHETGRHEALSEPQAAAMLIKSVPITTHGLAGLERAISSVGGLPIESLDANYMLKAAPGIFAAGEMLDWDAPTGGYLLQACFATGRAAGKGVLRWLEKREDE